MRLIIRQWFDLTNPSSELAARYAVLILWVIGSIYLMAFEWAKSPFDFIVFAATPIVWATIISLPVIGLFAWRNGRYIASLLICVCAIIGVTYTSANTISRQAIQRDTNIENKDSDDKKREKLEWSLDQNQKMLNDELKLKRKKCDSNPRFDCTQIEWSVGVYEKAVKSDKADLKALGKPISISAGENRIAKFIAMITGNEEKDSRYFVGLVLPAVFGVFIELTAFALAMYGWHNYGFPMKTYNSRLSDKTFKIDVLNHQLAIAKQSNNSVDIRVLTKQLDDAKELLRRELK